MSPVRTWFALGATLIVASGVFVTGGQAAPAHGATVHAAPSALMPLTPCRVLDTRDDGPARIGAGTEVAVPLAGQCGVPSNATAVSVVITAVAAAADGYATAWPSGTPTPFTSVLNVDAGDTRSAGAIVAVSNDGRAALSLRGSVDAEWIIDITGAWTPAVVPRAGRFVPIAPTRLLDTRSAGVSVAPGGSVRVPLPAGAPADTSAVMVTITATESRASGFVSAYAAGTPRPNAAALFVDRPGLTRSSGLVVPASASGIDVYVHGGAHIVVDAVGWFTGGSAPASDDGRFVAMTPTRVIDTRTGSPVFPNGTREVAVGSTIGTSAAAVAMTLTITDTWRAGFVAVAPARTGRPGTAAATADHRRDTVAQLVVSGVTPAGVAVTSSAGTDVVADLSGWFTGPAVIATTAIAPNVPVNDRDRRVLMVGDSTLAGVRWYTNSQRALGGSTFVLDAESCRRLVGTSCRGREGRVPSNAVDAIEAATVPGRPFDTVVVMTGYNDWYTNFDVALQRVVGAARAAGAREIVWLTYRERTAYLNPTGGTPQDRGYRIQNELLRAAVASGAYPDLVIGDWNGYTSERPTWVTPDGVHLTVRGSYGVADYVSRIIAHESGEPCPSPWTVNGALDTPCPHPDDRPLTADPLELYAGNPNEIHCYEVGTDRHTECRVDPRLG
jgi:hypothetical protein